MEECSFSIESSIAAQNHQSSYRVVTAGVSVSFSTAYFYDLEKEKKMGEFFLALFRSLGKVKRGESVGWMDTGLVYEAGATQPIFYDGKYLPSAFSD
uniref:Peptidase A1 domain-containing protein n=1 Tax=Syphacia muris TaxID=451379 RepID=A0A0N5A930_9BILA